MKRWLLILLALVVLAATVAAAATLSSRDEADPVDAGQVSEGPAAYEPDPADQQEPGLRPAAGTYTYEGTGRESIDTLGGSEHQFPDRILARVQYAPAADGCRDRWTLRLLYLQQHTERRSYCTTERSVREEAFSREIEFFRVTDRTSFRCERQALRLQLGARPGSSWTYGCEGSDRRLDYTVTYLGREQLRIDGSTVQAHHVRVSTKLSGASDGSDRSEYWYAASGLPLRWSSELDVQTDSALGRTRFREQTRYSLVSVRPRR